VPETHGTRRVRNAIYGPIRAPGPTVRNDMGARFQVRAML